MSGEELKLLDTARRNVRTFINGATFKCRADQEAALACVDVLESHIQDQSNLIAILHDVVAIDAHPLPEQPQEGVREAAIEAAFRAIAGDDADPHMCPEAWDHAEAVALAVLAAISPMSQPQRMGQEFEAGDQSGRPLRAGLPMNGAGQAVSPVPVGIPDAAHHHRYETRPAPGLTNDDPMCINLYCPSAFSCRRFSHEPHQGPEGPTIFIDPRPTILGGLLCEDFQPDWLNQISDSDTRRMAETGTGSVRSTGSAGRKASPGSSSALQGGDK
ncbi:hypothetical protein [Sphingobium bisphenolivorans]|uniref:hypothetical protein n=1 Tax=Sphingobium bisphenolivorans TaxID=1335760 RepID=UPI0003B4C2D2|nr:hypothetical protein [Sphingobium bisphenolivorans]